MITVQHLPERRNLGVSHMYVHTTSQGEILIEYTSEVLNTLLKPTKKSLALTGLVYAPLFGKQLLSKVNSGNK